ncbi:MAG: winged helix-turn-helix domain-containing protein [Pseudomonadota bacterium]
MTTERFQLAKIDIDPSTNRLTCGTRSLSLEPRAMQVLHLLLQRRGTVVSRREIFDLVWRSAEVTDDALNRTVFDVRKALRTLQPGLEPIETIRKVGYRLVDPPADQTRDGPRFPGIALRFVGVGLLAVLWVLGRTGLSGPQATLVDIQPFSTQQSFDTHPSFHPDGRRVFFSCSTADSEQPGLCVQDVDSLTSNVLLSAGGEGVAVHPDGKRIAYQATEGTGCEIRVFHLEDRSHDLLTPCHRRNDGSLAWSVDGRHLFYSDLGSPGAGPFEIRSVPAEGGPISTVTRPPVHSVGDLFPALAPDGRTLAFFRADRISTLSTYVTPGIGRVYAAPINGGYRDETRMLRTLTAEPAEVTGLVWVGTGSKADLVFFSNAKGNGYSLWRLPTGRQPQVTHHGFSGIVRQPAVSASGVVIAEQWTADADIYSRALAEATGPANRLFSSNRYDFAPAPAPDGAYLAWVSSRSGPPLLWIGSLDSGRVVRSVQLPKGVAVESPRWSPDSRQIAFEVRRKGTSQIALYTLGTDSTQWLTVPGDNRTPSWALDGRSLYFSSNRSGDWEVWRYGLADSDTTRLTSGGAYAQREYRTRADRGLIFSRRDQPGLWKLPFGGVAERIVEDLSSEHWGNWTVHDDQIYFARNQQGDAEVVAVDIGTGSRRTIVALDQPVLRESTNLSIAPDGKTLFYASRSQLSADLIRLRIDP